MLGCATVSILGSDVTVPEVTANMEDYKEHSVLQNLLKT
jgi:hypothetical protein